MQTADRPLNLMDVDLLVETFLKEREQGIATMHRIYFKGGDQISLRALKEEVKEELRTGCVCYLNKESSLEDLNNYLFYIVNAFCKKISHPFIAKQKIEYICPGCLFLGKECAALNFEEVFRCEECRFELKETSDPKKAFFFTIFATHNKRGYHCSDCDRFIPHPLNNSTQVSCPYFDCLFVGPISDLHKMHHPASKSNPEKLILDVSQESGLSMKDNVPSQEIDAHTQVEMAEDLQEKVQALQEIIETQKNCVPYSSSEATVKHKQFVYQAFANLLKDFPADMVSYLLDNRESHMGFQHKIFQEYISLLEQSFPLYVTKRKKLYKIDSLLDNTLFLFDGISVFEGSVNDRLTIKNGTQEFYIGGRKAFYTKPYYIGKLLNIIHRDTKASLMHLVKDYSFSKIRMHDIETDTPTIVTHLRVPPHYQMGGMAYVNRIRKKIVDRAKVVTI